MIDSRDSEPKIVLVKLPGELGTKPTSPACVRTSRGKHYAFVFHDLQSNGVDESEEETQSGKPAESLSIVDLDPNGDGDFKDAIVAKALSVGRSVEGHNGHHSTAFDGAGRRAYFTNPGDATVALLRLDTLEPQATFAIGGRPDSLIAVGGRETRD